MKDIQFFYTTCRHSFYQFLQVFHNFLILKKMDFKKNCLSPEIKFK